MTIVAGHRGEAEIGERGRAAGSIGACEHHAPRRLAGRQGGPVVTAVGGRHTLLISALLTIALGAAVAAVLRHARRGR